MRRKIAYLMVVALVAMVFSAVPMSVSATWTGDVTILSDGTVVPADAPIHVNGMKYTLTDDILGSITIQMSSITLDGAGHTLEGTGLGYGIFLFGLSGITIKDFIVKNYDIGIITVFCDTSTIKENEVSDCYNAGIHLYGSNDNTIKENKLHNNFWEGIWLEESSNNIIKDNEAWKNGEAGIWLWYWCDNNVIKDNNLHENGDPTWGAGVFLMYYCDNNLIRDNDASNKNGVGIALWGSDENTVSENTISRNLVGGVYVYFCTGGNIITKNTISNNYAFGQNGIRLWSSSGTIVSQNTISGSYGGLLIYKNPEGTSNLITENTIRNNYKGIQLSYDSYDNQIHHNNFMNNDIQAQDHGIGNLFDDGSEGNFWSDYKGKDNDKDGIGDTPYLTEGAAGSQDNCPLMKPWNW
ncbi:MAG: right-handed parallel beta-helix repeat-containing protein [Thermoplasmata archaeon]|nr:MAG: right-handed parallel beta-helix repeat-containing protein [Thermoplasmata archaeon]